MSCNAKQCEPTVEKIFGLDAWPCETIQSFFFAYGLHDDQVAILMAMTVLSAVLPCVDPNSPDDDEGRGSGLDGTAGQRRVAAQRAATAGSAVRIRGVHKLRASRQGLTHLADSQTLLRRKMLDPKHRDRDCWRLGFHVQEGRDFCLWRTALYRVSAFVKEEGGVVCR